MRYATRNNALEPAVTWVLDDAVLRLEDGNAPPREIPLREIAGIELTFSPTRFEPNRFLCRLRLNGGGQREFFNRTYRGIADFQDTSAEYTTFVRQLHEALARHHPGCRFAAGVSGARYALNVAALILAGVVLLGALMFFVLVGLVWVALIKLVLVVFYTPAALRWLKRNHMRTYDPLAIPKELLPCP